MKTYYIWYDSMQMRARAVSKARLANGDYETVRARSILVARKLAKIRFWREHAFAVLSYAGIHPHDAADIAGLDKET